MPSIRSRGLRPLTRAVLVSLCFALPACIEDVIVPPPDNDVCPPDSPGQPTPVQPPVNHQSVYYDALRYAESVEQFLSGAGCGIAGCHDPATALGRFVLIRFPARGSAEMWSNLQFVTSLVDLGVTPFVAENTEFFQWATNNHAGATFFDPEALRGWLEDAASRYPAGAEPFDEVVFQNEIQPSLDGAGCNVAGCHEPAGTLPPALFSNPVPGSPEMEANLREVIQLIDLGVPYFDDTLFFRRATDNHAGRVLDAGGEAALASWITSAQFAAAE